MRREEQVRAWNAERRARRSFLPAMYMQTDRQVRAWDAARRARRLLCRRERTCPAGVLAKLVKDMVRAVFVVVERDHEGVDSTLLHDVSELGRKLVELGHVRDGRVEVRRGVHERLKAFALVAGRH